jgi:GTPase involved in cell partitioning and DNA repair
MPTIFRTTVAAWAGAALCLPALAVPDASGVKPGDEAMTCEQIATELAPYAQQMQPNLQALALSRQEQFHQAREKQAARQAEGTALSAMATAGALDPTGASKRAYMAAELAQSAKHRSEDAAAANSPLAKQADAQQKELVAQGEQMQGNARLQRLMQLGHQKGCDKK